MYVITQSLLFIIIPKDWDEKGRTQYIFQTSGTRLARRVTKGSKHMFVFSGKPSIWGLINFSRTQMDTNHICLLAGTNHFIPF